MKNLIVFALIFVAHTNGLRYIKVGNSNSFPIWIETQANSNQPALTSAIVQINPGSNKIYDIKDSGWGGRLWAKVGCDKNGANCASGQSVAPCPSGGCQPPAETKVEFFFPSISSPDDSYYDISLVDGYSLASEITPYKDGKSYNSGSCIPTNCKLSLSACPTNEINGLGDLTVRDSKKNPVACLSPCKKWNYPSPYGYGRNEQQGDGRLLCCPDPVTVKECRNGIVVKTNFVNLVRRACPTAYSYSYDDEGGLHNCPSNINYVVNFYS